MVFGIGKKLDLDQDDRRAQLTQAIEKIPVPALGGTVGELGLLGELAGKKNTLEVQLKLPTPALVGRDALAQAIKAAAEPIIGADPDVAIRIDAHVLPAVQDQGGKTGIDGIKNVILVASGKGGVGKSTVAVNFAAALSELGAKVGLLDSDVYGPSVPTMAGVSEGARPGTLPSGNPDRPLIVPFERHGLKLMSMGFLVDTSTPMVWRGPMIASASMQLFRDVAWGELDYLVVDLPPGTGDIHLTISQQILVTSAIIVSTPQDVALADVVRAKSMFDKVNIPCAGIVENMSYFICDNCDKRHEIFTHGGARRAGERLGLPFLGEIPIEAAVREGGDQGVPAVLSHPESQSAKAFLSLAAQVATSLAKDAMAADSGPTIRITGSGGGGGASKGGLPIVS